MSILDTIEAMESAGVDAAAILATVKKLAERDEQREAEKREAARNRKRRQRAGQVVEIATSCPRDIAGQGVTARDGADPLPSPQTPLPTPSPSKNPPKGGQKGSLSPSSREVFDRVWKLLPQQARRSGEIACLPAFARAVGSGADPADIEAAVGPWLEKSGERVERFDRWVSGGLWREWLPAQRSEPTTPSEWRSFVGYFQRKGEWCAPGPAPGQPGCKAPQGVLAEFGYGEGKAA
jgi:hypothetical protein